MKWEPWNKAEEEEAKEQKKKVACLCSESASFSLSLVYVRSACVSIIGDGQLFPIYCLEANIDLSGPDVQLFELQLISRPCMVFA